MRKITLTKVLFVSLAIAAIGANGFFYFSPSAAEAKSTATKWQKMLEQNGVDSALWQKYLPNITRADYNALKGSLKKMGSSANQASTAKTTNTAQTGSLGPEISVGLWYNSKSDNFKIDANKSYNIRDGGENGKIIAQIAAGSTTKVTYGSNDNLQVSGSIASAAVSDKVIFDAADGDNSSLIFNVHNSNYSHYRGKIEVKYYHGVDTYGGNYSSTVSQIWIINKLPLEQYVWGMGEIKGTGPSDHNRVMATVFRTYGDWYIENSNKYKNYDFEIRNDSNSQIYGGYDWESKCPNIRKAADDTRGKIVTYKGDVALTPYCSYTDGKTRSLDGYPYLKSVDDNKAGIQKNLKPGDNGNHMWGLSAHGSLGFAGEGKSWTWILQYYYTGVKISDAY
jgi:hypothetical protein